MGLLDDAIREHLELKRLRGADPDEVARLEREALGPPHRRAEAHSEEPVALRADDFQSAPAARSGDRTAAVSAHGIYDEHDEPRPRTVAATAQDTQEHDMAAELHGEAELHGNRLDDRPRARQHEEEWRDEDEEDRAPHGRPRDEDDPHATGHGEDRDRQGGRDAAEDDDVLEGTPAFLQEAPEHDRLWFEQEPPRDFDFDK